MRLEVTVLILFFAGPPHARAVRDMRLYRHAYTYSMQRMFETMRSYYDAGETRIKLVNNKRFEFEDTKEYEEGYLMGEIIERYRMMVEHVQTMYRYTAYSYIDCLLRVEQIQKIYFEVYHLVNMMHELPRKYGQVVRGEDNVGAGPILESEELPSNIEDLQRIYEHTKDKATKKKIRQYHKKLKKQQTIRDLNSNWTTFHTSKRPSRWPLEYGWEI